MWFDAGMTVEVSFHVTVNKEFLATHITRIAHISGMLPRKYHIIGSKIRRRKKRQTDRKRERPRTTIKANQRVRNSLAKEFIVRQRVTEKQIISLFFRSYIVDLIYL